MQSIQTEDYSNDQPFDQFFGANASVSAQVLDVDHMSALVADFQANPEAYPTEWDSDS